MSTTINLTCLKHKTYLGKIYPRSGCATCYFIFKLAKENFIPDSLAMENLLVMRED